MRQPLGSRTHGIIDYAVGGSLVGASRLPVLRRRFAGRALLAAGTGHVLYSLVTDYEVGLLRKLPYPAHLAVDAVAAAGLLVAGLTRGDALDRLPLVAVGLQELTVVALSDPKGQGAA